MKESMDNRQSKKEKDGRRGASGWNIRGPEEATQHRGPLDWTIRGDASRKAHGARPGTSWEDWNNRGAEGTDERGHEEQES